MLAVWSGALNREDSSLPSPAPPRNVALSHAKGTTAALPAAPSAARRRRGAGGGGGAGCGGGSPDTAQLIAAAFACQQQRPAPAPPSHRLRVCPKAAAVTGAPLAFFFSSLLEERSDGLVTFSCWVSVVPLTEMGKGGNQKKKPTHI